MRLLIFTQTVDRTDPALGFFHRWIEELAPHFEHLIVVCLKEGNHALPPNVEVLSLGKEQGVPRFAKIFRFYRYTFGRRSAYDAVFVHMNQEYVLMGGWFWKLMGKKIYLWRNHYSGSVLTGIAAAFCTKVFCTSKFSYTARYKKTVIMPVGVDLESAHMEIPVERLPRSILFLARLDESKRPDLLIEALGALAKQGITFSATIAGGPTDPKSAYPERLRAQAKKEGIGERVAFTGAIPNTETFRQYRSHEVFLNLSRSGMLDKTMFKAAACGCVVVTASRDFAAMLGDDRFIFPEDDVQILCERIKAALALPDGERTAVVTREQVMLREQSLPALAERLAQEIQA